MITTNPDGTFVQIDPNTRRVEKVLRSHKNLSDVEQMGYFGNIWVRSHTFKNAGDTNGGGHKHNFDHVTLLAIGSVLVEVEGYEPKEFHGPTFIVIDKDHSHKFTALTDNVVYYCVFAVRDLDGEVTDIVADANSPLVPYFTNMSKESKIKLKQEK